VVVKSGDNGSDRLTATTVAANDSNEELNGGTTKTQRTTYKAMKVE